MEISLFTTLVAVFITVGLVAWSIGDSVVARSSVTRRRLDALVAEGETVGLIVPEGQATARENRLVPISPKNMGQLRRRLTTAGFHHPQAATYFTALQLVLAATLLALPLVVIGQSRGFIMAIMGGIIG